MRHAVIMAGGSGLRLWPLSRAGRPKQLLPLFAGRSLLEIAYERALAVARPENVHVCAGADQRDAILAALRGLAPANYIAEPAGRDTLPAAGLAALALRERDSDAAIVTLTADHLIEPLDALAACVDRAFSLVETDPRRLVVFAIKPTRPATGYGYVEFAGAVDSAAPPTPPPTTSPTPRALAVARFVEKPDDETARAYVESGRHAWNSGMFVWRADALLGAVKRFRPDAAEGLARIESAWGAPDRDTQLASVYPTLPRISIDFAVMEPASASEDFPVVAVEADLAWTDVGDFAALAAALGGRSAPGSVLDDCADTVVISEDEGHTIAAIGLDDVIIVRTADATLVLPAARAQDVKALHARLPDGLK